MSTKNYAAETTVSQERSIEEIKSTLRRFGAHSFCSYEDDRAGIAGIEFDMNDRRCRFVVKMPEKKDFAKTDAGRPRAANQILLEWEKAGRARWRSLALIVKAKLVAVNDGVLSFEQEFALHFVMDSGITVFEALLPALDKNCSLSTLPALMPGKPS